MNSRSSQPFVWIIVALLTAALYTSAMKWVSFSFPFSKIHTEQTKRIDLSFIEFTQPTPEAEPIEQPDLPEPEPLPEPPPPPEPEPTPEPAPTPIPEPAKTPPPPIAEPPPPTKPKVDAALLRKKREAEEARELRRQRDAARKRLEEKRRQQLAAQKAAATKKKAAALAKARAAAKARNAAAKRITSKPSPLSRPSPRYPRSAKRAGHEGTVTLNFTVGTTGKVSSIRISKSSGHSSLDNAALSAIRKWRFKPARNGLGQAVSYNYSLPIPFKLR